MVLRLALLLTAVLTAAGCSRGETVTRVALKDGTALHGTTVETRLDGIVLKTVDGQLRTIPLTTIAEVRNATDTEIAALGNQRGDVSSPLRGAGSDVQRTADGTERETGANPGPGHAGSGTADNKGQHGRDPARGSGGAEPRDRQDPRQARETERKGNERIDSERGNHAVTDGGASGLSAPKGTRLLVRLETALGSDTNAVEDAVRATLTRALTIDGVEMLRAGTELRGSIVEIKKAGHIQKSSKVVVRFHTIMLDSSPLRMQAQTVRWELGSDRNWFIAGAGAAVGSVVGAVAGGGSGAAKGATVGGAAGAGYVIATEGKNIRIKTGAPLTLTLSEPLALPLSAHR